MLANGRLATCYSFNGVTDRAIDCIKVAIELARTLKDSGCEHRYLGLLGLYHSFKGNNTEAVQTIGLAAEPRSGSGTSTGRVFTLAA